MSARSPPPRLIQRIVRLALETFSVLTDAQPRINGGGAVDCSTAAFNERFNQLTRLVNQLTGDEVGFDPAWLSGARHVTERHPAPHMSYIRLLEHDTLSVGIFILYTGFVMPLHDHPHMYGLLKVLCGRVSVQSFTRVDCADSRAWDVRASRLGRLYRTKAGEMRVLDNSGAACVLTPRQNNIHRVAAADGRPAAFLDILAPPYDDERRCFHCYKQLAPDVVASETDERVDAQDSWLVRVRDAGFVSDSFEYRGPTLQHVVEQYEASRR